LSPVGPRLLRFILEGGFFTIQCDSNDSIARRSVTAAARRNHET
jgi:hypothetical protein